jgi:O-antigen/teichoic acid export membrane protein
MASEFNLTKGIFALFLTNILVAVLAIPTSIIVARALGPHDKGIYTLVLLVPGLLDQLGNLGLAGANTYFIGSKRFSLTDIASNSLVFGTMASVSLAALFLLAYRYFLPPFFQNVDPSLIYLILLAVPFSITPIYFRHILLAKFRVKEFNLFNILQSALLLGGSAVILLLLNKGVFSLVLLSILISMVMFGFSFLRVNRLAEIRFRLKRGLLKESLRYGIKVHLANLFTFLHYRSDIFLVSYFIGATQVGFYSIAVGIAEMVWMIPSSIQTILFPVVASSGPGESKETTGTLLRHTLLVTLLACVGLAVFGRWAIVILYGSAFLPSFMPLLILLPGIMAVSLTSISAAYLAGIGKPIFAMYASLASLGLNIGLNLLFIPEWGIVGAALATSISYSLGFFIVFFFFLKLSGGKPRDILLVKPEDIRFYIGIAKGLVRRVSSLHKR